MASAAAAAERVLAVYRSGAEGSAVGVAVLAIGLRSCYLEFGFHEAAATEQAATTPCV